MQLREGTEVLTSDGEKAGEVERVVLDPMSNEVTHLVVQKGFLFKTEKVVPISAVGPASVDKVTLWKTGDELDKLPDYVEKSYVAAEVQPTSLRPMENVESPVRPLYAYPPFVLPGTISSTSHVLPDYVERIENNIPEATIAMEAGAKVLSSDGVQIGQLAVIYVDSESEQATHLLVDDGLLFGEKKLVPISWASRIREHAVELSVAADVIRNLPNFENDRNKEDTNGGSDL